MKIEGSVALVTGASSGIGEAAAVALAAAGASVVVMARREDRLEAVAERCRKDAPSSFAAVGDVARREDCEKVIAQAQERLGSVDILINNAGISSHKSAAEMTVDDVERVMAVNFFGSVYPTLAALPGMIERGRGHVVSVTSVAGYIPNPKETAYAASKAALSMWTHGIGVDLHGTGVHTSVVAPGPIDTEIWEWDESPSSYQGKKYPPSVVAKAIVKAIRREIPHLTVPRQFGAPAVMFALPGVNRALRWGLIRFEEQGEAKRSRQS
ncbi:MAG: SDR family NAD(P)-dependent oxidoreductase [Actinobacteria bacterium]|nr:SDR family NAD(P)-dependent oxidoreductase [Actinomycetota bacterium]